LKFLSLPHSVAYLLGLSLFGTPKIYDLEKIVVTIGESSDTWDLAGHWIFGLDPPESFVSVRFEFVSRSQHQRDNKNKTTCVSRGRRGRRLPRWKFKRRRSSGTKRTLRIENSNCLAFRWDKSLGCAKRRRRSGEIQRAGERNLFGVDLV